MPSSRLIAGVDLSLRKILPELITQWTSFCTETQVSEKHERDVNARVQASWFINDILTL